MSSIETPTANPIRYTAPMAKKNPNIGGSDYAFARRFPDRIRLTVPGVTPNCRPISTWVNSLALMASTSCTDSLVLWWRSFKGKRFLLPASWQFSPRVPTDKWSGLMQGGLSQL